MPSMRSGNKPLRKWQFEALGTLWSIETPHELAVDVRQELTSRIELFDKTYSRFRRDSLVWALRQPGEHTFPADVTQIMELYKKLYDITHGRMTPLIGGMLEEAGYDTDYSLRAQPITAIPPFEALGWDGEQTFITHESIVLDIGAAGKGYLVDIVARLLEQHQVLTYTIDASGDIKQKGRFEAVGLEHPIDSTKIIGVANVQDQSLCASAINRRAWGEFHHVFDPMTKQSTDSMLATWVLADSTMLADALATALFFVPAATLLKHFSFSYVTMQPTGAIDVSPHFDGELFV